MVLPGQNFHEDLHATPQAQHQVQRAAKPQAQRLKGVLLLDVVRQRPPIFELLSTENRT